MVQYARLVHSFCLHHFCITVISRVLEVLKNFIGIEVINFSDCLLRQTGALAVVDALDDERISKLRVRFVAVD